MQAFSIGQTLIYARQRPIIAPGLCLLLRPLPQLALQLAPVSPLALGSLFLSAPTALPGGFARDWGPHHTPVTFPGAAPAPSSVLRWLLKLVPSQYPPTMLMTMSTPVTICTRRLPS